MMLFVKICRSDGGVSISSLADGADDSDIARHVAQWEDVQSDGAGWKVVSFQEVQPSEIPQDRTFRDAWRHDLSVCHAKATEITKERLRAERKPLMAELDTAYMRALESGSDTALIVAEKTRLRDITKLADACTTLEELKALGARRGN